MKVVGCLSEIQIYLGTLCFQLLTLKTLAKGAMMGTHVGSLGQARFFWMLARWGMGSGRPLLGPLSTSSTFHTQNSGHCINRRLLIGSHCPIVVIDPAPFQDFHLSPQTPT